MNHQLDNQEAISTLLQGKEIVINADIAQSINHNAIKFNEIGVYFKLLNTTTTLQQELDALLFTFQVTMKHLGNSYYRCGNQFYIINHSTAQITHYVVPKNAQYAGPNGIYSTIQANLPILSPYTMWKIQLFHDHDDGTIFDRLTKYTNQSINLELVGKGQYLQKNDPICKENLTEYYKVVDNILQLDSNHKHRHHHGDNHQRERRDVDDANNMPYDINSITAAVSTIESILKPISDNTVNDIENNISNLKGQNIGMVDHISIEDISSSANRIKLPIKTAIHWLSNSRLGQLKFFNPTNMINYEFIKDSIQSMFGESKQLNNYTTNYSNNAVNITKFYVNESLALADFIIRCVTKVKPYNTKEESINLLEVKAYVLNIITKFEEKLNELSVQSNLPIESLKFYPVDLMCKLEKEIDKAYDGPILVNNLIQHWNNKLDLLSTKAELNISSLIPSYDYRTYNLITDTIYKILSTLGFKESYSSMGPDKSSQVYYELECESINSTDDVTHHKHRHHHENRDPRGSKHADIGMHRCSKDIEDELKFKDTGEYEVLVSRNDTDHMMFSSASSTKPIGYNALNWVKEQVDKIQELTFSNFIESVGRWYKSDENNISDKMVAMKDSNIVSDTVSNIDDLITDTNIFSDQDALALNHVPLLSNESTTDFVSTNNAFNMNGTLMLANLVVRMMTPVKQDTTVNNNVVDYGHAHRLAYSSYAPGIEENAEYTELMLSITHKSYTSIPTKIL